MRGRNLYIIAGCNGAGIKNLFNLYMDSVDYWILADNSNSIRKVVARGRKNRDSEIFDYTLFNTIKGYVR